VGEVHLAFHFHPEEKLVKARHRTNFLYTGTRVELRVVIAEATNLNLCSLVKKNLGFSHDHPADLLA
jgi:hypothetical protein